ncbi:hypothetical protein QTP81_04640 [Alteromonas sp. ASW11-36]|uniref:STAS/SEC14 domain-containing protein n=1 Tax=Alteromonas arenosi TaxID=3055817 RepID=A0ABT7SUL8_9ALTE|nr:hypothetical protein [Alteromonas sp. ASW11-36]MDM7859888.1 hypothetical protein [Alteromonas sp. ASW11-36]
MEVYKSQFASHGSFSIKVINHCMIVDARGPYNKEIVDEYESTMQTAIESLSSRCWGQIICLYGMSMFTPDAERRLAQTVENRKHMGLKASAIILVDVEAKSLVIQQMSSVYERCGVVFQFFECVEQGHAWINQELSP